MFWHVVVMFGFFFNFSYLLLSCRYNDKFSLCENDCNCVEISTCRSFLFITTSLSTIASLICGIVIMTDILDTILSGKFYTHTAIFMFLCMAGIFSAAGYFTFINIYYKQIKNVKEKEKKNKEKENKEKDKTSEENFSLISKFKINKSNSYKQKIKINSNTYEIHLPTYVYHDIKKDVDNFIDLMKVISNVLEKTPGDVARACIESELKQYFSSIEELATSIKEVKQHGKIYNNYIIKLKEIFNNLTYEDIILNNKQKFYKENTKRLDIEN